ncbi:MAG TPA: hypothetical protein VN814_04675 [Caulobacteraceae bacterium]|nr:hypothetical protein [Caulobacteraceae bacterium]
MSTTCAAIAPSPLFGQVAAEATCVRVPGLTGNGVGQLGGWGAAAVRSGQFNFNLEASALRSPILSQSDIASVAAIFAASRAL